MEKNSRGISQNCGCDLARPYVNDQVLTKMYNLSTALSKGTLFPELFLIDSEMYNADLYKNPKNRVRGEKIMKQSCTRSELLRNVQETGFACVELNLYLDNHPEDKNAINIYNSLVAQFKQARCAYESKYGPLTNFGYAPSQYPWQWICDPWPWDREFNK